MHAQAHGKQLTEEAAKVANTPISGGIGHTLLQQMGWQGGGLGRQSEGIAKPLSDVLSMQNNRLGLGAGGSRNVEFRVVGCRVNPEP